MKNRFFLALSAGFILALFNSPLITSAAFRDVPDNHPYKTAIDFVQSEGIVSGYPDGTFQPDRKLNRAEFTKIIIAARFGSTDIETCANSGGFYKQVIFTDVEPAVWFEKYVCLAKKNTIIGGYPDGSFKPTQTIIFAEAAKIIVESYGLNITAGDPWFTPYLQALEQRNAVPRSLASITDPIARATKEITRAEMAEIIRLVGISDDKIVSDDGNFILSVPENALPSGVTRDQISIRKLPQTEQPVEEVNGAPMLFYDLQPDGLQFREEVSFQLSTPTVGNAIPLVFLVTAKDFEMLPEPAIEINQQRQLASLSGKLRHFSQIATAHVKLFGLTMADIGEQTVDEYFSVTASVERFNVPQTFIQHSTGITISLSAPWNLSGGFLQQRTGSLSPASIVDIPKIQTYSGPQIVTVMKNFTCLEPVSNAQLQYQALLGWTYEKKNGAETVFISRDTTIATKSNAFTCKPSSIPVPIPTPTPTPIPTPTPTPTTTNPDPNNLQCIGAPLKAPENGGVPVQVLKLQNGHCFPDPDQQFGSAVGVDVCPSEHYHGGPVYSLTGEQFTDPLSGMSPPECGFGRISQTNRAVIYIDAQRLNEVRAMYGTSPTPPPPPSEPTSYPVTAIEKFVMSDVCSHDPFIGLSSSMTFIVDNFDLTITGSTSSGSFTLTGSIDGSGNYSASGTATVAGFPGTSISMSGKVDGSSTSTITFGANGTLPDCGGVDHPISYGLVLATS